MSSEDSSNQVNLRNAYSGNSPSPHSPIGEQSLKVSCTESSQNSLASQRHEVAEEGDQGNGGASSSGRQPWSCVDLISTISLREANKIAPLYGVEVGFPQQTERAHNPPPGHVTVSETFLKFGVRFPLHPYFVKILNHYNLTVFQLSPNGWAQMIRYSSSLLSERWILLLRRNFPSSTHLPTRLTLGFITSLSVRRKTFRLLSKLKTASVLGKMPMFTHTKRM